MSNIPVKLHKNDRPRARRVRPRRDFTAMEERRMRAADLFEQGVRPAEIARQLGVWHQIVSDWRAAWRRSGRDGLRAAGRAGRLPKLNRDQLAQVESELIKGAEANGYPNDVWTLQRVAEVIEHVTGVSYHPAHVWSILRRDLAWTWQRPARRATERNDAAIHDWVKKRWPQLKKGKAPERTDRLRGRVRGVPAAVSARDVGPQRSHAGLRHPFNWKRLSLAGALVYEPDGSDAHLFFELRPGAYNDETLIEFLSELNDIEQRRVLVIWDGLPSHRSRRMSDWIATQRHWLSAERLPGYAPELNPIENVWANLKSQELANLCADTIGQVAAIAEDGLDRIGSDADLCFAFLHHSGLRL
jgi:transposase